MAKKLLISDLDGTLLNNITQLSQSYSDKLNAFLERGIDFTIATGRDFENTKLALKHTHIHNPVILTNGAIMADFPEGNVIEYLTIPPKIVSKIYEITEQFDLNIMVFAFYDKQNNYPRFVKGKWFNPKAITRLLPQEFTQYLSEPVISIQFMNPKTTLDELYALSIKDKSIMKNSHILYFEDAFLPGQYWLEYNPINARKEVMVSSLIKRKGYSPEDVIVFGDNYNDIGMFELAGTVAVVENAPEEIKQYANHIIPSNREGGVLQFIESHLEDLV